MADISAEAEVTFTNGSTSVNVIITPRLVHNWDKPNIKSILLPILLENQISTKNVDLGMNKFVLTFDGIIRDDDTTTAETRLSNLYTLFNYQGNVNVSWGSSTTSLGASGGSVYQRSGGLIIGFILKVEIREIIGRTSTDWATRQRTGTYKKIYEVTIQFLVGDRMEV